MSDDNISGDKLTTEHGNTVCADGDSHQPFSVDLEKYSDDKIDRLEIRIETQRDDGAWTDRGSNVSTFGF